MSPRYYQVRCSNCGKTQKYYSLANNPRGKKKRCIWCNRTFTIYKTQEDNQIKLWGEKDYSKKY